MAAKAVALACTEIIRIMAAHKAGSSPRARRIIDIGFTDAAWSVQLTCLSRENRATLRNSGDITNDAYGDSGRVGWRGDHSLAPMASICSISLRCASMISPHRSTNS